MFKAVVQTLPMLAQYSKLEHKPFSISDGFLEDMQALMPKDVIMPQLVHMLSNENSDVQRCGADTLSEFAEYGEHELAWKSFSISDGVLEDMRALMPKNVIMTQLGSHSACLMGFQRTCEL